MKLETMNNCQPTFWVLDFTSPHYVSTLYENVYGENEK